MDGFIFSPLKDSENWRPPRHCPLKLVYVCIICVCLVMLFCWWVFTTAIQAIKRSDSSYNRMLWVSTHKYFFPSFSRLFLSYTPNFKWQKLIREFFVLFFHLSKIKKWQKNPIIFCHWEWGNLTNLIARSKYWSYDYHVIPDEFIIKVKFVSKVCQ